MAAGAVAAGAVAGPFAGPFLPEASRTKRPDASFASDEGGEDTAVQTNVHERGLTFSFCKIVPILEI